jgi:site-specific recombinase XerD
MKTLIQEFLDSMENEKKLQTRTVVAYKRDLMSFYDYVKQTLNIEAVEIVDIDRSLIKDFLRSTKKKGGPISANYRNRILSCLRAFFSYLQREGRIKTNPAEKVEWAKVRINEPEALTYNEQRKIRRLIEKNTSDFYQKRDLAIWDTLVMTGIRASELISLNVDDVDFENQFLRGIMRKGGERKHLEVGSQVLLAIKRWLYARKKMGIDEREPALFLSNRKQRLSVRDRYFKRTFSSIPLFFPRDRYFKRTFSSIPLFFPPLISSYPSSNRVSTFSFR